jgi:ubiquinone/menaquinone biosynthesis C-methylase UbiE
MIKRVQAIIFLFLGFYSYGVEDTTNESLYLGLCTEFWDLDKPVAPTNQYNFFRRYVAKASGPVLEPMCGTGRFLIPLAEEGFDIEGFDASPFMFKELCKKCKAKNISPRVWEQYLEEVPETKKYNLIIIPDTSITIFTNVQQIKKSLKKLYALLNKGGKLILDVQTTNASWGTVGIWTGKAHKRSDGHIIVESWLPLPIQNSISPLVSRYDLMNKTEIIKTETEYYEAKLYQSKEMDALLKEAGFKKIKRMKGYDPKALPSPEDDVIVYECIKK